jgi:hypothetical protein
MKIKQNSNSTRPNQSAFVFIYISIGEGSSGRLIIAANHSDRASSTFFQFISSRLRLQVTLQHQIVGNTCFYAF